MALRERSSDCKQVAIIVYLANGIIFEQFKMAEICVDCEFTGGKFLKFAKLVKSGSEKKERKLHFIACKLFAQKNTD